MAWTLLLKGLGVVTLLGSTIAVPLTVSKYFGPKPIELKSLKDYQKHCLVVGPKEEPKILGCQVTTTGSSVDFYLYKKNGGGDNNASFSKIKSVKSTTDQTNVTIAITKEDSKAPVTDSSETVKLEKTNKWVQAVDGLELKGRCKADWQKTSEDKKKKISCKNNRDESVETEELDSFSPVVSK